METLVAVKPWFVWGALMISVLAFVVAGTYEHARDAWMRAKPLSRFMFLVGVLGITLYGGSKGTITFPYTDPEARYLVDAGSYVTNDAIYVAFTRAAGVPNSAPLLIDRRQCDSTDDDDWISFTNTTIGAFNQPQEIAFAAATNWNWVVYTTWTPAPAVQTNGVWHTYWGLDGKAKIRIIPCRAAIRVDGEVISTPESKRRADENRP